MVGIPCPFWTRTKAFCLSEKEKLIYLLQFNPVQAGLYLAGISEAELDLTFTGLSYCRHFQRGNVGIWMFRAVTPENDETWATE